MKTDKADLNDIICTQRSILSRAEKAGRDLTEAEEARFSELDDLYSKQSGESKNQKDWADNIYIPGFSDKNVSSRGNLDSVKDNFRYWANPQGESRRHAFNRYLVQGPQSLTATEFRALQVDSDIAGGYLVMPETISNKVIMGLDDAVFMRQLSTVYPVPHADSLGVPTLDNDPADADWTSELKTGSEDSSMDFEKRNLAPKPAAKRIRVSNKLLRCSTLNPEALVINRLVYKFAITQEKAFLSGTGANQPLGVFVASDFGISTSRDVSTGNTVSAIKPDGLINALYELKSQYIGKASWIFHRDAIKQIRKLKDGEGNYLWQSGIAEGKPANILGRPYYMSEYCPNTFTTGQYVGVVGDFKNGFWIADALQMQIAVLKELYAESNLTGYIGRIECDGMPVLEECFVRVTLA